MSYDFIPLASCRRAYRCTPHRHARFSRRVFLRDAHRFSRLARHSGQRAKLCGPCRNNCCPARRVAHFAMPGAAHSARIVAPAVVCLTRRAAKPPRHRLRSVHTCAPADGSSPGTFVLHHLRSACGAIPAFSSSAGWPPPLPPPFSSDRPVLSLRRAIAAPCA